MKEQWNSKKIEELIDDKLIGIVRNNKEQGNNYQYNYFKMNNIQNDNGLSKEIYTKINATQEEIDKYSLCDGDFLFNTRNSYELVGKVCCYVSTNSEPTLFNNNIMRLRFKKNILPKFIYYQFCTKKIKFELDKIKSGTTSVVGIYYKQLKNIIFYIPSLSKQHQIVAILDKAFEAIEKAEANIKKNIENAEELFQSKLHEVFSDDKNMIEKKLTDLCEQIFAGGDVPKESFRKEKNSFYNIPIYANGIKNKGLYGFTNIKRVEKNSLTISARGTIGHIEIRKEAYYPVVRLINLIPNNDIKSIEYFYYLLRKEKFDNTGTSIPQLTVPMLKNKILYIHFEYQQEEIVKILDQLKEQTDQLISHYKTKLDDLEELKKSILEKAFNGELI